MDATHTDSRGPLAGLHWVTDSEPGIARRRQGQAFVYRNAAGWPLRDAGTLARIRALVLPPAWRDVWICARDDGHLQATGRDARGRKQYRYHALWQQGRGQTKYEQLREFALVLPRIRQRVQRALADTAGPPTRERVLASLVRLLDTTWLRIGNEEYARSNGSYGLTTLRSRHAVVRGDELRLSFKGKSGVRHEVRLTDRRVARVVRGCSALPGQELFQYMDDEVVHRVGSSEVNAWLAEAAGGHFTAKDFRTWHGSVLALKATLAACAPASDGAGCKASDIVASVARQLGNTPAVCKRAYIHPRVLELANTVHDADGRAALVARSWARRPPAVAGLVMAERRLLGLLRSQAVRPARAQTK